MHNESSHLLKMPDSHFLAGQKREGERKRDKAEKVRGLEWQDEEMRANQLELDTEIQKAAMSVSFSYLSIYLPSFSINLSFNSFSLQVQSTPIISIHAYPCMVLPHLQLSLFSSTTWCSSMYRSLRVSDSVSLSSNTCCWRSASLLSDDAESSPPSILLFRPTLPVSLSPSASHTCVHFPDCYFFFLFSFWGEYKCSLGLLPDVSPLFAFHLHLPFFSLDLSMTESCSSNLWVLHCLLPESAS